jgi:hypothetical protein
MRDDDHDFDCVGFKRRAQAEIYERIKDLTWAEEVELIRRHVEEGPFADFWRRVRESQAEREAAQRRATG